MRRPKPIAPRRYDRNIDLAYEAGHRARLEGRPVSKCPNLTIQFGEVYGTKLADAWMRGWFERDAQMRQQPEQLALKGVD